MRFYFICRIAEQDGLYMFTDNTDWQLRCDHCLDFSEKEQSTVFFYTVAFLGICII